VDRKTFDDGLAIRAEVLGQDYVVNSMGSADDFSKPFQDFVIEYCWGALWARDGLTRKARSMVNIAMIAVLNRPHELALHLRGALTNGVTREEIREILLQVGVYAGVPAASASFRIARETFAEIDNG
jgi:4-carboxymuconolactone decarboxylase